MFEQNLEELKRARGSFRGAKPLSSNLPLMLRLHLPIMERGIQGVR